MVKQNIYCTLVKVDTQRQKCAVPKQERDRVNAEPRESCKTINKLKCSIKDRRAVKIERRSLQLKRSLQPKKD